MREFILNIYFKRTLLIDLIIGAFFYIVDWKIDYIRFKYLEKDKQLDLISNVISTDIGIAAFVLASLTIIVAFKSNSQARGDSNSRVNALNMLLNSGNYKRIVSVFKIALVELVLIILALYILWISSQNITNIKMSMITLPAIILTVTTLSRCLYVLSTIMTAENNNHPQQ